jgi:hypothetical protein
LLIQEKVGFWYIFISLLDVFFLCVLLRHARGSVFVISRNYMCKCCWVSVAVMRNYQCLLFLDLSDSIVKYSYNINRAIICWFYVITLYRVTMNRCF